MGTISFFFWLFISLAIGFFASTQNRNPFGYFLGAMVFSPREFHQTAQPYTMLMLSGEIHVDYWSKNGVGDDWLVRGVRHKGKSFWTVLEEK